jgi:hypothetical protein
MAVTLYEFDHAGGDSLTFYDAVEDLRAWNFSDRTSAISVTGHAAVFYEGINFGGRHWTLDPGNYTTAELEHRGIHNNSISSFVA